VAYTSISINELITEINSNKYYLPAIQRKFVWGEKKICDLFDSIMRGYPIGTFLFWELSAQKAKNYTFYEFLKNYHQRDSKNLVVNYRFSHDIKGVLDGQQRISSMYIALQGIYQTKRKYARKTTDNAYEERMLYLNLLSSKSDFEFKFLTKEDAAKYEKKRCYFLVRDALEQEDLSEANKLVDEVIKASSTDINWTAKEEELAIEKVTSLIEKLNDNQQISYFSIVDKDLDEILDIFVRVNSGGLILSKSDLLFSTLVAHWEDGRKSIEKLVEEMNGRDDKFQFNTDFLMRTCLFLIDAPINFKIQSFDAKNIDKIKTNWSSISSALLTTVDLLKDFGFDHTRMSSNYAATPIAYYIYKGGKLTKPIKLDIRKFTVNSLLKQVYSGQADNTLRAIRNGLREKVSDSNGGYRLISKEFSYSSIKDIRLPAGKRIAITQEDVEGFLQMKKSSHTFLVLSTLYPHFKLDQIEFHQDHMHPQSKFTQAKLSKLGLSEEQIEDWISKRDELPNLQLLKGTENKAKQAKFLKTWIENHEPNEAIYRKENYVPAKQSLDFEDFEAFFEKRKTLLEKRLLKELVE